MDTRHDMAPLDMHDLTGMLSKSKGQILRVAATLYNLFHLDDRSLYLKDSVITAAINVVEICCQQAAL